MNERQKGLVRDIGKNIGMVGVSIGAVYVLGQSFNVVAAFKSTDIMGKIFYGIFGLLVLYNLAMAIRKLATMKKEVTPRQQPAGVSLPPLQQPLQQGVSEHREGLPQYEYVQQPPQASAPMAYPKQVSPDSTFDKFNRELESNFEGLGISNELENRGMVDYIEKRVIEFNDRLDLDVSDLEEQYKEMEDLKKSIHQNVEAMHASYKKLEQQMQVTQGMIRTKKLVREKLKQMG